MAQLVRTRKVSDSPKTPSRQISPTFEQLLRVEKDVPWPSSTSPSFGMHHDQEEYGSSTPSKKSVIAKVKERAKKLKFSLSLKRKQIFEQNDDNNGNPPWGVNLDDYDDETDEDPEYLGAPMYESEAAPKSLRETARQHPRAVPVVSENHKVPSMTRHAERAQENEKHADTNKTMADAVSQKLGPAYAAVSDATHKITSKIADLTVATAQTQGTAAGPCQNQGGAHENAPAHGTCDVSDKLGNPKQHSASDPQTPDKGVSIKEYLMNKLEPGDDERALSQAISDAISPRRSRDTGVVEKMKGAVTLLFRLEDTNSSAKDSNSASDVTKTPTFTQQKGRINLAKAHSSIASYQTRATSPPSNSNAQQVPEEQNHGKILQTN